MGTHTYTQIGHGKTGEEAYRLLQERAEAEHGHEQGYSGYINCCDTCWESKLDQKRFTKAAIRRWMELTSFGDGKDNWGLDKRECCYLYIPKTYKGYVTHSLNRGVKTFIFCVAAPE
jgi:hypothetical protein